MADSAAAASKNAALARARSANVQALKRRCSELSRKTPIIASDASTLDQEAEGVLTGSAAIDAATAAGFKVLQVDTEVSVYWEGCDEWFETRVLGHAASTADGKLKFVHRCEYPGGTMEHDLSEVDYALANEEELEIDENEAELALKVAAIRKQLRIPESVSLERVADMVPVEGTITEKIHALHSKLLTSAGSEATPPSSNDVEACDTVQAERSAVYAVRDAMAGGSAEPSTPLAESSRGQALARARSANSKKRARTPDSSAEAVDQPVKAQQRA